MKAVLLSTDLIAHSSAEGAARRAGVPFAVVPPGRATERVDEGVGLVAIDLTSPIDDLPGLIRSLFALAPDATLVAFGPHVHEERLEAAKLAGCDLVVSRGKFQSGFEQMLRDRFAVELDR
ncbi:MAG: hypothetical protein ACRCT8_17690 [Lacipirellulaceae bacterium]